MQLVPNIVAIVDGMKAAKRLYEVIDRKSTMSNLVLREQGIRK
jgi:hypothetical protein